MEKETAGVLERHAKKERNAAYKAGLVIAACLLLPIIITFLVSLANGGSFGVFSVVTASMLLVAALTVVPLMSHEKRIVKSILFAVIALLLIFFFVDRMNGGGEFILWSVPTIFGLSVPFFPLIIRGVSLPPVLSNKKALITMTWDTLWLFLTIFVVCHHYGDMEGLKNGCTISAIIMTGVWLAFLTARYLPVNTGIKGGIIAIICSIWLVFSNDAYVLLSEGKKQLSILSTDFSNWSSNACINANVYTLILISGAVISVILILTGIIKMKRQKNAL